MPPSVSILLLMKNERENLEKSFDIIENQVYGGPVEYVYIDSGSTDGTVEFMRDRGIEAIAIDPKDFHHGRTRNLAASKAKHDILIYLSGDARPTDDCWLANLVAPFEDPKVGGVYGKQLPPKGMGALRRHALEHEYPDTRIVRDLAEAGQIHPGLFRFSNANSAIRRSIWEQFPFDESLLLAEDQGMCYAIMTHGMRVVYEPAAAVVHGHERTLWGEFRFAFENGASLTRVGILGNPEVGGEGGYGLRRVRDDLTHFLGKGQVLNTAKVLTVDAAKWVGVQLGKREQKLPLWFVKRITPAITQVRDS